MGDEYDQGDPNDSDLTNDFDDIFGVRISVTLGTNRPDIRVAGGGEFTRELRVEAPSAQPDVREEPVAASQKDFWTQASMGS